MQQERAEKVWQRVRGEEPSPAWLGQLLADQREETALWHRLARRRGGVFSRVAREKGAMLRCLRGIWVLASGGAPEPSLPPAAGEGDLRRSAARGLALCRIFADHSRDADFGPVFRDLEQRQRQHCCLTLELLSRSGERPTPPASPPAR